MNHLLEQLRPLVDVAQYRLARDREIDRRFVEEVLAPLVEDLLHQAFEKIDHLHAFGSERINQVIHYTRATTVEALLKGAAAELDSSLRLYDSASFNDPDEGQFLVRNLSLPSRHHWILRSTTPDAYIVSFIIPDASLKLSDDLMFWRTYGREGEGCSLVLSVPPTRLREIFYGTKHVQAVREALVPFLDVLHPLVAGRASPSRNLLRTALGTAVWRVLAKVKYLYKSDAYSYERECRVVVLESEVQPEAITFEPEKSNGSIFRIRHYVEDPDLRVEQVLATNSQIILGPCIERPDNLRFYFETLRQLGGWSRGHPTIRKSGIVYRRA